MFNILLLKKTHCLFTRKMAPKRKAQPDSSNGNTEGQNNNNQMDQMFNLMQQQMLMMQQQMQQQQQQFQQQMLQQAAHPGHQVPPAAPKSLSSNFSR